MKKRRLTEVTIIFLGILIGALTNVATGELPDMLPPEWRDNLWLAWIPLGVAVVVVIGLEWRARGGEIATTSGGTIYGDKVGGDKVLGNQTNIDTESGDYAEGDIDKRAGVFISGGTVQGPVIGQQTIVHPPAAFPLTPQQQRNRRRMLDKVEAFWVRGVLDQSLYQIARIELGLRYEPDAVAHPWESIVQRPGQPNMPSPANKPIIEVFDELGGELLILGAPGAGKTTLLLELARDLIARARLDGQHFIPVVFNLSTWVVTRQPLDQWLIEELNQRYDVSKKLARTWITENMILPLLDGLDEVVSEQRFACLEVINNYRHDRGLVPLAVCSRAEEYAALTKKLRLESAIVVQPLTRKKVDEYLKPEMFVGIRTLLQVDPMLRELLDTPLMLSIVALTYKEKSPARLEAPKTLNELRQRLFDDYIVAMFVRRNIETRYVPKQTIKWLCWLAKRMMEQNQTIFRIEYMQPNGLSSRAQKWMYKVTFAVVITLIYFSSIIVLPISLSYSNTREVFLLCLGFVVGIASVVSVIVFVELYLGPLDIEVPEKLRWSWSELRDGLARQLSVGLAVARLGFIGGIVFGSLLFPKYVLASALVGALSGFLSALNIGISSGFVSEEIEAKTMPNEGIWRAVHNGIFSGLVFGLAGGIIEGIIAGLVVGVGINLFGGFGGVFALVFGFGFGLGLSFGFMKYGGVSFLKHFILRAVYTFYRYIPFHYSRFLDYCAERIFLRKVGGGYIFVHRLLMEHFASLYAEGKSPEPVEAQRANS